MSTSIQRRPESPIQTRTELVRFRGIEVYSQFALAIQWAEEKFDVNGYYKLLGLPLERPVLMWEILKAYRDKVRQYHPDSGEEDVAMLERLRIAYEVLSDPEKRMEYDDLPPGEIWMDELEQEAFLRRRAEMARDQQEVIEDVLETGMTNLTRTSYTPTETAHPSVRSPETLPLSGFLFYGYSDDPVEVEDPYPWLAEVAKAYWEAGFVAQVLVGFTSSRFLVDDQGWGVIVFVPVRAPRDSVVARALVDQALEAVGRKA